MKKINISKVIANLKKEKKPDLNVKLTKALSPVCNERNMLDEEFYGKEMIKEGMYEPKT